MERYDDRRWTLKVIDWMFTAPAVGGDVAGALEKGRFAEAMEITGREVRRGRGWEFAPKAVACWIAAECKAKENGEVAFAALADSLERRSKMGRYGE